MTSCLTQIMQIVKESLIIYPKSNHFPMEALNKEYKDGLDAIAKELQESPELALYLDEEEEAQFTRLKEMFEPKIGLMYDKLSEFHPLQIIPFEKRLLEEDFEGLYLPKILGYSVLRGEINENYNNHLNKK
mgnify:CR=1 FL=1